MNLEEEGFNEWKAFEMRKKDTEYVYVLKSINKKIKRKKREV